jgi:hypothetical protein
MADTWIMLANEREAQLARQAKVLLSNLDVDHQLNP